MTAADFLADLERKPDALARLAGVVRREDPWPLPARPDRIVLLGMGSSAYAADVAAARLRAEGRVAVSELAGSDLLPDWGPDTLVIAVSASGRSPETVSALDRIGPATTIALTNEPDSPLAERCDHTVELSAGNELGGVACRTYQHAVAMLMALQARLAGRPPGQVADALDRAAEATSDLLGRRERWLAPVTELLGGPAGTHLVAPARRLGSARQGALMLREGPRRAAVACEASDWAHVDVYLTKNTDYRLLAFAGSRWDAAIHEWTAPRDTPVVAVGGTFPDAAYTLRYPHDEVDDVRLLTEVLVPELVAARLWTSGDE